MQLTSPPNLISPPWIQQLPHGSSGRQGPWRYGNSHPLCINLIELPRYAKQELQATIIQVKGLQRNIKLASFYCLPKHNLKAAHFNAFFQTLGPCFVAGGDFNSKHTLWGSRLTATKGRELASLIRTNNYSYLSTGTPTYPPTNPNKLPDLLDFFLFAGISPSYADI